MRMSPSCRGLLTAGDQALECVFADCLEHPEPHIIQATATRCALLSQQTLVDQRLDSREWFESKCAIWIANVGDRIQRKPADKNRKLAEQHLLCARQQVMAPIDRTAQRLLACWLVARAAFEQPEPTIEPVQERLRWQDPGACR